MICFSRWIRDPVLCVCLSATLATLISAYAGYFFDPTYFYYTPVFLPLALVLAFCARYAQTELLRHGKYDLEFGAVYKTIGTKRFHGRYYAIIREESSKIYYRLSLKKRPPYYFRIVSTDNGRHVIPYFRVISGAKTLKSAS